MSPCPAGLTLPAWRSLSNVSPVLRNGSTKASGCMRKDWPLWAGVAYGKNDSRPRVPWRVYPNLSVCFTIQVTGNSCRLICRTDHSRQCSGAMTRVCDLHMYQCVCVPSLEQRSVTPGETARNNCTNKLALPRRSLRTYNETSQLSR